MRRYGVGGALWREHPGLPAKPVIHWQVLNEVNGPTSGEAPSAAGYADFLKLTASAIRGTDPNAKVVLAGLGEKMPSGCATTCPRSTGSPVSLPTST